MAARIDAPTLKASLSDGRELALIDVRELGQFGEGHLFFAVPLAYSRFELGLATLVPNPSVRLVLCDAGDGVAERAAARAEALGYDNVAVLAGGIDAWRKAGYTLYAGVNVPSKTFGELVELQRHTPRLSAPQVQAMRDAGENFVIVDGRPFSRIQQDEHPGRGLLSERRTASAYPRHCPRCPDQDHRQLCRSHPLDHRRANA